MLGWVDLDDCGCRTIGQEGAKRLKDELGDVMVGEETDR